MKPVLIVEGKRQKVSCISFYDATEPTALVEVEEGFQTREIDKNEVAILLWENRNKPVIDTLNAHLEESEQYLQELKMKIAESVIHNNDNLPFPFEEKTLQSLVEEYKNHKVYIEGLVASIELVRGLESVVSSTDE